MDARMLVAAKLQIRKLARCAGASVADARLARVMGVSRMGYGQFCLCFKLHDALRANSGAPSFSVPCSLRQQQLVQLLIT